MTMIQLNIIDRVMRGAALLDQKRPGWETEIDLPTLNIASTESCILGQLYDHDYFRGCAELLGFASHDRAFDHGFACWEFVSCVCEQLTEAWRHVILTRRQELQDIALMTYEPNIKRADFAIAG